MNSLDKHASRPRRRRLPHHLHFSLGQVVGFHHGVYALLVEARQRVREQLKLALASRGASNPLLERIQNQLEAGELLHHVVRTRSHQRHWHNILTIVNRGLEKRCAYHTLRSGTIPIYEESFGKHMYLYTKHYLCIIYAQAMLINI